MAYQPVDYLKKVGEDGFAIIEKHYGRGNNQRHAPAPLPARSCWQDQHPKLTPNQYQTEPYSYDYQEPRQEANYATVKEPAFRSHRPTAAAKQGYETWYFIPVPQAPTKEGIEISSTEAAKQYRGMLFMDYGYKSTKPYRRGYN